LYTFSSEDSVLTYRKTKGPSRLEDEFFRVSPSYGMHLDPPIITGVGVVVRTQDELQVRLSHRLGWGGRETPVSIPLCQRAGAQQFSEASQGLPKSVGRNGTRGLAMCGRRIFVGIGRSIAAFDLV